MNKNLLRILISVIFLFISSNVQAEWITKKKNDETRYQDLTNNELINDIQNEVDAITYASGDYFVYAIKYNKSGDIKEYFTGSLYQTSKYKVEVL